ncbi:MAG: hypothetical protein FGM40_07545 [Rhodocyclaceae bacterium]|nr:hypothetical protein [Rhodocyclaceae bacterium]
MRCRVSPRAPAAGHSTLEVCVAAALLGLTASGTLGAATAAQRDATLAGMRQTAVALAEERLEALSTASGSDEAGWQARVAAALPGASARTQTSASGLTVEVRWRAPTVSDLRCPGLTCVRLHGGP